MMLNKKEFKQVMVLLMERIMYKQNFNRRVQYTGPQEERNSTQEKFYDYFLDAMNFKEGKHAFGNV